MLTWASQVALLLLLLLLSRFSRVSDSVRPHRWKPTSLPWPWDSPGKNTGVGCHCLLRQVALVVKNSPANTGDVMRRAFDPWVWKIPWREKWQATPVFLLGESPGYSP